MAAPNNELDDGVTHVLHKEDLLPITRRPFFLIVDSDNSLAFNVYRN